MLKPQSQSVKSVSESNSLTRNTVITQLTKSPHGQLDEYTLVGRAYAAQDPEFFAHLIAWDAKNGQIRDAHVALPIVSLAAEKYPTGLVENSLAHIAKLSPRDLVRAFRFAKSVKTPGRMRQIRDIVTRYVKARERSPKWFDRTALQDKESLKTLYGLVHISPSPWAQRILFSRDIPPGSIFAKVAGLSSMTAKEAAGTILENKIPFLIAQGALGPKAKDPDLVLAMLEVMTPNEIAANMKMLERLGVNQHPHLKAALGEALGRMVGESVKAALRPTAGAAARLAKKANETITDKKLRDKIHDTHEKQIANMKGIEGNWVVLGDKSGSMATAIEVSRHVAATLAKFVRGKVHLVFFDVAPRYLEATGKTYDQLVTDTQYITANGGTSIGCGLLAAIEKKAEIDGIAIVSDAAENSMPMFVDVYGSLVQAMGKSVPVYLYRVGGRTSFQDVDLAKSMKMRGHDLQEFDLRGGLDYYSLPNLVATMRANRYSLADEILETPLLSLSDVFKGEDAA